MSKRCPNCNHVRQDTNEAPDWQCPACKMAYNKGRGAALSEVHGRPATVPIASSGSRYMRWVLILVAIIVGIVLVKPGYDARVGLGRHRVAGMAGQPEVTLYATSWCGYCAATRKFFAANGIRYTELDIEQSSTARDAHRRLGGNGVPLIVIGDDVIHGFDEGALKTILEPWLDKS